MAFTLKQVQKMKRGDFIKNLSKHQTFYSIIYVVTNVWQCTNGSHILLHDENKAWMQIQFINKMPQIIKKEFKIK